MGLMYNMRTGTETGAMKFVLGAIVLVFVFWGVGPSGGPTSSVLAEVNGERITDTRFQKVMRNVLRRQGRSLSEDEQNSLSSRVLDQLIEAELFYQAADDMGITVSDEEVALGILESPDFQDESGKFSQELYERVLGRSGTKRAEFEEDIRQSLLIDKLVEIVSQGAAISKGQVLRAWEASATQLEVEVARVPNVAFHEAVMPTQEALDTFTTDNAAEISAWYQNHFESRFHKPRRAELRQIQLRADIPGTTTDELEKRMNAIRGEAAGGADFAQLAKKYSESDSASEGGSQGIVSEKQLDPELAPTIFGRTEAGLTDVVSTARGVYLFQIERFLDEETTSEEEAAPEIARTLYAVKEAPALATAFTGTLAEAWKTGTSPAEALALHGISLREVGPFAPNVDGVDGLPKIDALLTALLTAPQDAIVGPFGDEDAQVVAKVTAREDADETNYEEESGRVRAQLQLAQERELVEAWRIDLIDRANIKRYYKF